MVYKHTVEDIAAKYGLVRGMSKGTVEYTGPNPWNRSKDFAQNDGFALTASGPFRGSAIDRHAQKQYSSREVAENEGIPYHEYDGSDSDPNKNKVSLQPAFEKTYDNRSLEERGLNADARKFFKISGAEEISSNWGEARLWATFHADGTPGRRRRKYRYPQLQLQDAVKKGQKPKVIKTNWENKNLDLGCPVAYNLNLVEAGEIVYVVNSELGVWLFWQEGLRAVAPFGEQRSEKTVRAILNELKSKGVSEIRVLLDNDKAGRTGAVRFWNVARVLKIPVVVYDTTTAPKIGWDACDIWEFWRDGIKKRGQTPTAFQDNLDLLLVASDRTMASWSQNAAQIELEQKTAHVEKSLDSLGRVLDKEQNLPDTDTTESTQSRESAAVQLLTMLRMNQVFHTVEENAYIIIEKPGGIKRTYDIEEGSFGKWAAYQWFIATGNVAKPDLIRQVQKTLSALALFEGPRLHTHIRHAAFMDKIYIDLCNDAGEVIQITKEGWEITTESPVFFRRAYGMEELPAPVRPEHGDNSYTWEQFKKLINYGDDRNWALIVAWMVSALVPGKWPCPCLSLHGEQGSAKSWLTRLVRQTVDPNRGFMVQHVREERDVVVVAEQMRVFALDNQDKMEPWLSNLLASMITGTPHTCRTLFKDDEHKIFQAQPAMILNGIPPKIGQSDLADRMLKLQIPKIVDKGYKRESQVLEDWEPLRPHLLAAICDAMVAGLRNKGREEELLAGRKLPRMADFATWVLCCEEELPFEVGTFYKAYTSNIVESASAELDDLFPQVVLEFVNKNGAFSGTAKNLLIALNRQAIEVLMAKEADEAQEAAMSEEAKKAAYRHNTERMRGVLERMRSWPQTENSMVIQLTKISGPLLKSAGLHVERLKRTSAGVPWSLRFVEQKSDEQVATRIATMPTETPMLLNDDDDDPFGDPDEHYPAN